MTDAPKEDATTPPADSGTDPASAATAPDWQAIQRNFAERLFPGATRQMTPQMQKRIDNLLKPFDPDDPDDWRNKRRAARESRQPSHPNQPSLPASTAPQASGSADPAATVGDIAQLQEALNKQNELLQAILSTQVDTQADARSTAQNSRTFAWAGSVIAILTLVATVISIVAAIQGR
jgi:hypothetical protein